MSKDRDFAMSIKRLQIKNEQTEPIYPYLYGINFYADNAISGAVSLTFFGNVTYDSAIKSIVKRYRDKGQYLGHEVSNIDYGFRIKVFYDKDDKTNFKVHDVTTKSPV